MAVVAASRPCGRAVTGEICSPLGHPSHCRDPAAACGAWQLEVLSGNGRAFGNRTCSFAREGVGREAVLYPDGWKDFILVAVLQPGCPPAARNG